LGRSFSSPRSEEDEVREANAAFYKAFESLDVSRMAEVWLRAGHVRCVHPGGELLTGYDAVLRGWEEIFSHTVSIRFEVSQVSVHLRGDLAWVTAQETVQISAHTGFSRGVMIATNVFERDGGLWRIVHHHAAPAPSGPPPPRPRQTLH
jgi:ketosteroid isomerase-like protein